MAGRPRKPQADKDLAGNPSKAASEPEYHSITGGPQPPADLHDTERVVWDRIVGWMESTGRVESIDSDAILRYCVLWCTFLSARVAIQKHGAVVRGQGGGLVKNPAFQVLNDCGKALDVLSAKFGLTPKDRQNLGITGKGDSEDTLEGILS